MPPSSELPTPSGLLRSAAHLLARLQVLMGTCSCGHCSALASRTMCCFAPWSNARGLCTTPSRHLSPALAVNYAVSIRYRSLSRFENASRRHVTAPARVTGSVSARGSVPVAPPAFLFPFPRCFRRPLLASSPVSAAHVVVASSAILHIAEGAACWTLCVPDAPN